MKPILGGAWKALVVVLLFMPPLICSAYESAMSGDLNIPGKLILHIHDASGNDLYSTVNVFSAGTNTEIAGTSSSTPVIEIPPGTYDIKVYYIDLMKSQWLRGVILNAGESTEKTVKFDFGQVTFNILDPVGNEHYSAVTAYKAGTKEEVAGHSSSHARLILPVGTYDIEVYSMDLLKTIRLENVSVSDGSNITQTVQFSADAPLAVRSVASTPHPMQVSQKPWALWCNQALDACSKAVTVWQRQATFVTIIINGSVGTGHPGCLIGPYLGNTIQSEMNQNGVPDEVAKCFANSIGSAWTAWQSGLSVTLHYPSFAAWPGPVANPTPNVPIPLLAAHSSGSPFCTNPEVIKQSLLNCLGSIADSSASETAIDRFANDFTIRFQCWRSIVLIANVMGTGPVPSFAPPHVVVGPVVGGCVIATPPHFSSARF